MQASFQRWADSFSGPAAGRSQVASAPLDCSFGQLKDFLLWLAVVTPGMKDSPVRPSEKPGCQNKHFSFLKASARDIMDEIRLGLVQQASRLPEHPFYFLL